jgi:hypothetical protein
LQAIAPKGRGEFLMDAIAATGLGQILLLLGELGLQLVKMGELLTQGPKLREVVFALLLAIALALLQLLHLGLHIGTVLQLRGEGF